MNSKTERLELRLDPEILDRIDEWRREQTSVPNRSVAVRRLIELGLGHSEDSRLFQMARFSVLVAAKTKSSKTALSDAYVYAWENSVYPAFHDSTEFHKPFADQFWTTKDEVSKLGQYLDARWLKKDVPTFYELEDNYDVRSGQTN
ncbi:MAG: hypothetical protein ACJ8AT_18535 [Hyalangium sp.]|uniref:hypothetical protein n=1 Tax=Hyalangium sp. TaxID=2028555 RepID=UPI00389A6A8F